MLQEILARGAMPMHHAVVLLQHLEEDAIAANGASSAAVRMCARVCTAGASNTPGRTSHPGFFDSFGRYSPC